MNDLGGDLRRQKPGRRDKLLAVPSTNSHDSGYASHVFMDLSSRVEPLTIVFLHEVDEMLCMAYVPGFKVTKVTSIKKGLQR